MVYDLRARLFEHLQALGLQHHITTNTGDAVYRIDVDSYSIENLVMVREYAAVYQKIVEGHRAGSHR